MQPPRIVALRGSAPSQFGTTSPRQLPRSDRGESPTGTTRRAHCLLNLTIPLFALWSANSRTKAVIDGLNVAYREAEKRSFIRLNLISLVFTLGAFLSLTLAVGAVVVAPIVLTHLGLGGVAVLAGSPGVRHHRACDSLPLRAEPTRDATLTVRHVDETADQKAGSASSKRGKSWENAPPRDAREHFYGAPCR
jgi:hypothetical protein